MPTPQTRRSERDRALDRTVAVALLLGLLAFYFSIQAGVFISWDGKVMAGVGRNLWQHASLHTFQGSFGINPSWHPGVPEGWSKYGIGVSLLTVPLWALQLHFAPNELGFVTFTNALVMALTGAVVYLCGVELDWDRTVAVYTTLIFGLLTMAPIYSTELFSEPSLTLAVVVVLLGLLRWERARPGGPLLVGIGLSVAVLFRSDAYATVAIPTLLLVPAFVPLHRLAKSWRGWLPALGGPLCIATGWTLAYNAMRFGSPFQFSYPGEGFTFPFGDGLYRQLMSPGKGFFWYNPILIAGVVGVALLFRRRRGAALAIIVLCLVRPLFYAKWWAPEGGAFWGPRFLLPACALLAFGVGELIVWTRSRARRPRIAIRGAVVCLAVLSGIITVISLWVPWEQQSFQINNPTTLPTNAALAHVEVSRRVDRTFNTWAESPIHYNLTHLTAAHRRGEGWKGGVSAPGMASVGMAITFFFFAWWAARRRPRAPTASLVAVSGGTVAPERPRQADPGPR